MNLHTKLIPQEANDWRNQPCTKLQREYIELRRVELRMIYPDLLSLINQHWVPSPITDIGQLTKGQASLLLDYLIGMCERRENQ